MIPETATVGAFLEPRHVALAAEVARFVAAEIAPLPAPADDDAARAQAREILRRLGAGGWLAHVVPQRFGGSEHAPDLRACCLIREALAAASPLADAVFALQCLGSLPLVLARAEDACATWLPRVLAGDAMTAFAMTEPEAGSDVRSLATAARRDGDGWRIDGGKTLISNAGIADLYCVYAATPEHGERSIGCFAVPAGTPGLVFARAQVLAAPHPLGELRFEACRVPAGALLGAPDGGFKLGMRTLDRLRPTVAAAACGMASRALAEALAHVRARRQFGEPLASFEIVQQKLAVMATELDAARLLTYRAAWEADRGAPSVTREAAMAKWFATEAAQRVVDQAVQLLGGLGVLAENPVDRLYRAVRALRIYEGTTEIQHLVIARALLRD